MRLAVESETRRTDLLRLPGIVGPTTAVIGVVEANGKDFLHLHALAAAGVPSAALQVALGDPELHESLRKYYGVTCSAEFSEPLHVFSILRRLSGLPPYRPPFDLLPLLQSDETERFDPSVLDDERYRKLRERLYERGHMAAERVQPHVNHGSRCKQGAQGKVQCALSMPQALNDGLHIVQLTPDEPARADFEAAPARMPTATHPLSRDSRVFAVEMQRRAFDGTVYREALQLEAVTALAGSGAITASAEAHACVADRRDGASLVQAGAQRWLSLGVLPAHATAEFLQPLMVELLHACDSGILPPLHVMGALLSCLPPASVAGFDAHLSDRNETISSYNPALTAVRGCNTAFYPLPGGPAAQAAVFYTLNYLKGSMADPSSILSLLIHAKDRHRKYGSTAPDAGTHKRDVQYHLNVMANKASTLNQHGVLEASVSLLGFELEPLTFKTAVVNVRELLEHARVTAGDAVLAMKFIIDGVVDGGVVDVQQTAEVAPEDDEEQGDNDACDNDVIYDRDQLCARLPRSRGRLGATVVDHDPGPGTVEVIADGSALLVARSTDGFLFRHTVFGDFTPAEFVAGCYLAKLTEAQAAESLATEASAAASGGGVTSGPATRVTASGAGRKGSRVYPLRDCPLQHAFGIKLRSKLVAPLSHPPLPSYPKGSWWLTARGCRLAHKFAQHMVLLYGPWDLVTSLPRYELNHTGLVAMLSDFIDQGHIERVEWVHNCADHLGAVASELKTTVMKYRARNAHVWAAPRPDAGAFFNRTSIETSVEAGGAVGAGAVEGETLTQEQMDTAYAALRTHAQEMIDDSAKHLARNAESQRRCERVAESARQLLAPPSLADGLAAAPVVFGTGAVVSLPHSEAEVSAATTRLQNNPMPEPSVADKVLELAGRPPCYVLSGAPGTPPVHVLEAIKALPHGQQEAFEVAQKIIDAHALAFGAIDIANDKPLQRPSGPPTRVIVSGGGGAGKSNIIHTIRAYAEFCGVKVLTSAPMGIAANAIGGHTVHSMLSRGNEWDKVKKGMPRLTRNQVTERRAWYDADRVALIIVDEQFAVQPELMVHQFNALYDVFGCNLPVMAFGDGFQLPPPGERISALYDVVVKMYVLDQVAELSALQREAAEIFAKFTKLELPASLNMRCDDTPSGREYASITRSLRTWAVGARPVGEHLLPHLVSGRFVLQPEDVAANPGWLGVPICVPGNLLRTHLISELGRDMARRENTVFVKWKRPLPDGLVLTNEEEDALYADPRAWGYYVQGTTAYFTSSLSAKRETTNGLKGVFHSLVHHDDEAEAVVQLLGTAVVGSELEIPCPHSVNVEVLGVPVWKFRDVSLVQGRSVLTVPLRAGAGDTYVLPGRGNANLALRVHHVEVGFVATMMFRVQGRTVRDGILADLRHPMRMPYRTC